jgi:hypothetical protein
VVAHRVLRTPDDGRKEHTKHVEKSCSEIKCRLLSAASHWKLIYIRLVMHGTMNGKLIFINPQPILLYTKKECITWALRFLTIFLHTIKIYPIMLGNLKFV